MRTTVKSVIEQANVNIEKLIESVLDHERTERNGFCTSPELQYNDSCIHNCTKCKNQYFEKRKEQLRNEYYLKAE
jgi:hypothetical protein